MIVMTMSENDSPGNQFIFENSGTDEVAFVARVDNESMAGFLIGHQITIGSQVADGQANNFHREMIQLLFVLEYIYVHTYLDKE